MAAELTSQHFRQVHREPGLGAAYAKSVNQATPAPDAGWRALVANPDRPSIASSASVPVNAITGWVAPDEIAVAIAPGKWFANRAMDPPDAKWIALLENSARPSIDAGRAAPVNAIEALLERAAAAPSRAGEL